MVFMEVIIHFHVQHTVRIKYLSDGTALGPTQALVGLYDPRNRAPLSSMQMN